MSGPVDHKQKVMISSNVWSFREASSALSQELVVGLDLGKINILYLEEEARSTLKKFTDVANVGEGSGANTSEDREITK